MKKAVKLGIGLLVLGAGAVLALRYAALPYAEGRLEAALRGAGFPTAALMRTGLRLYGLGYAIAPAPGQPAVMTLELNPTLSLLSRKLVLTRASVALDANWQLSGHAGSGGEAMPLIRNLEKPLSLPAIPVSLGALEVTTPLGVLELGGTYDGRAFTGTWQLDGHDGTLAFTQDGAGAYEVQLASIHSIYPAAVVVRGGTARPFMQASMSIPEYKAGEHRLSGIRLAVNDKAVDGYVVDVGMTAMLDASKLDVTGSANLLEQTAKLNATGAYKAEGLEVVGAKARAELTSLWPPVVKNGATLSATAVQVGGLPLIGPQASFGYQNNRLNLQSAAASLFGGRVSLAPVRLALPLHKAQVTATFSALDLAQVLQLAAVDGLGGEGKISGSIPVSYDNGRLTLGAAQLRAEQAGQIAYRPAAAPAFLAAGGSGELLAQVFSDFRFSALTVSLGGTLGDNLTLGARLEGRNPSFYNGHPVAFNLNLSGALESLLTKGLQSFQFSPEAIKQMTEEGSRP